MHFVHSCAHVSSRRVEDSKGAWQWRIYHSLASDPEGMVAHECHVSISGMSLTQLFLICEYIFSYPDTIFR